MSRTENSREVRHPTNRLSTFDYQVCADRSVLASQTKEPSCPMIDADRRQAEAEDRIRRAGPQAPVIVAAENYLIESGGRVVITNPQFLDGLDLFTKKATEALVRTGDVVILQGGRV